MDPSVKIQTRYVNGIAMDSVYDGLYTMMLRRDTLPYWYFISINQAINCIRYNQIQSGSKK